MPVSAIITAQQILLPTYKWVVYVNGSPVGVAVITDEAKMRSVVRTQLTQFSTLKAPSSAP